MMSQSSNRFGLLEVLKKASIRKVKRFFFSIMSSFWSFYFIIYLTWVPLFWQIEQTNFSPLDWRINSSKSCHGATA